MKRKILAITLAIIMLLGLLATTLPFLVANSAGKTLIGDVNGDGMVDNLDATPILRYDAALLELTDAQLITANVNGDQWVDNLDAVMILLYDAGLLEKFPADTEESSESSEKESSKIEYPDGAYVVKNYSAKTDVIWTEVPKANIDIYKWVNSVRFTAYAQLVYVKDYGFLCRMTCFETNPIANYTQFGDPVYLDSCMEFFAAWDNVSYINLESNSVGAMCAQFGATNKNRKPLTDYLTMSEMFAMNPSVEADKWTLTMDIPLSKLQKIYSNSLSTDTFVSGYTFKGNFYKIGSDAVTGVRHYGMWTEVDGSTPNFHQPACFGTFVIE